MGTTLWLAALLLAQSTGAEVAVQDAMRPVASVMRGCFAMREATGGSAVLRFRVGGDGRAVDTRLERSSIADPHIGRCLVSAVSMASFPSHTVGRDVAYPVHYRDAARAPTADARLASSSLRLVHRPRALGDTWLVLRANGSPVSDIDLAAAAGDTALHASLTSKRNAYIGWAVAESVASVAGLVAAGIGGYGLSRGDDRHRTRDRSLVGGGLLITGVAGSLMLYHVLRALDVSVGRPVWHHLDQETARQLAARAR